MLPSIHAVTERIACTTAFVAEIVVLSFEGRECFI